jgi:hypothetical protein
MTGLHKSGSDIFGSIEVGHSWIRSATIRFKRKTVKLVSTKRIELQSSCSNVRIKQLSYYFKRFSLRNLNGEYTCIVCPYIFKRNWQ